MGSDYQRAVLLIPATGDLLRILGRELLQDRPPTLYKRGAGVWVAQPENGVPQALALVWAGRPIPAGLDRLLRVAGTLPAAKARLRDLGLLAGHAYTLSDAKAIALLAFDLGLGRIAVANRHGVEMGRDAVLGRLVEVAGE